jgi:hypothetical protein
MDFQGYKNRYSLEVAWILGIRTRNRHQITPQWNCRKFVVIAVILKNISNMPFMTIEIPVIPTLVEKEKCRKVEMSKGKKSK